VSRDLNVEEALKILKAFYITDSIQMLSRWIREGTIVASRTENRKDGWRITVANLYEFIEKKRPGWPRILALYKQDIDELDIEPDINEELYRLAIQPGINGTNEDTGSHKQCEVVGDNKPSETSKDCGQHQDSKADTGLLNELAEQVRSQQELLKLVSKRSAQLEQSMDDINQKLVNLWSREQIESYIENALANIGEQLELLGNVNQDDSGEGGT